MHDTAECYHAVYFYSVRSIGINISEVFIHHYNIMLHLYTVFLYNHYIT